MTDDCLEERHKLAKAERQKYVTAVLNSTARHKIVVAGPGTGKTYLFKQILQSKKKTLTLSFINTLVDDLMLDLCGLGEVKTLHSYAREALQQTSSKKIRMFGELSDIITTDAAILLNKEVKFKEMFYERDEANEHMKFYRQRKDYYDHYGYTDIVFGLVKHWERQPTKILQYEQVLVDEFQDFNRLEVSLIDLLAQRSPVLIAGDDDQAIYKFKLASADHIRDRHNEENATYAPFSLPHCSRCTRVIVDAANDLISAAQERGRLQGRIRKEYLYFDEEKKDEESAENPVLAYAQVFDRSIPYFIGKQIEDIAKSIKTKFGVLIISPLNKSLTRIVRGLRKKGFENIERQQGKEEVTILDGLRLLLDDPEGNLGWRIVCEPLLGAQRFSEFLKGINFEDGVRIVDAVDAETRSQVLALLKVAKKLRAEKPVKPEKLHEICKLANIDPLAPVNADLQEKFAEHTGGKLVGRKIPIRATTIEGSKGLAEQYVFITHFDDRYFIGAKDKTDVSDNDICKFLVALTRARQKVFLISTQPRAPTFLTWIRQERIQQIERDFG